MADRIQFQLDSEVAHTLAGLNECTAYVMVADQGKTERNAGLVRIAERCCHARVWHRNNQVSYYWGFYRPLAIEAPVVADLVVPVPDSGVTAALGYSDQTGIPFRFALIRNHYVGRTFIEPSQSVRDFGVKLKWNPVRHLLEGKRVVLIDDSIVRGTTSRKIVRMIRSAGAKEVHMRISCPPTISPCFYGVDTPSKKQLIAANKSVEEIREYIGADSLSYLSVDGLKRACGEGIKTNYCTACYTGKYPTNWVDVDEIQPAAVVVKH